MVPTPLLAVPTPQQVAALVYSSLDELVARLPDVPETHRFLTKLVIGPVPAHAPHLGPCLMWSRATTSRGYGAFRTSKVGSLFPGKSRTVAAHLWLDYVLHGAVPDGYELDHICHEPETCTAPAEQDPHRRCVLHTWRVTIRENRLRATHITAINAAKVRCDGADAPIDPITGEKIGHLLTDENGNDTDNCYRPPKNPQQRKCKACHRIRNSRWQAKARRLKSEARARGLREAGYLELATG